MIKSNPFLSSTITSLFASGKIDVVNTCYANKSAFSMNKIKVLNKCYANTFFSQDSCTQQEFTDSVNGFTFTFKPEALYNNQKNPTDTSKHLYTLPSDIFKPYNESQKQDICKDTATFFDPNLNRSQSLNITSKTKDPKNKTPSIKPNHDSFLDLQNFIKSIPYKNEWQELKGTILSQKQNNLLKLVRNKIHLVNSH
jgi:hypothetical protein